MQVSSARFLSKVARVPIAIYAMPGPRAAGFEDTRFHRRLQSYTEG
jgi:hypothetical protein